MGSWLNGKSAPIPNLARIVSRSSAAAEKRLPVLMYHHVGHPKAGSFPSLTVEPHQFEKQVDWLASTGYSPIRIGDWLDWRVGEGTLPAKPVLLTFDDAYADIADCALPVLEKYGYSAAVFVVTGEMGGCSSWDAGKGYATHRCMSVEQIRHWAGKGFEFGAHSRTHRDLTTLSPGSRQEEVFGSCLDLAEILGYHPRFFSYPFGQYNNGVQSLVSVVYEAAFTCEEGLNLAETRPCLLRRTMVQPEDSLLDVALRVRFGSNIIERCIRVARCHLRIRTRLRNLFGQPGG